jgi:hypothetical protein
MKLKMVLVVVLSLLCLGGAAVAADQDTYVEFKGPWSFILLQGSTYCSNGGTPADCVIAISPSKHHKKYAEFAGARTTPLTTGVYTLTLTGFKPADNSYSQKFVNATTTKQIFSPLVTPATPALDRYTVILPYAQLTAFEQPAGDDYVEEASISNDFVAPDQEFQEKPDQYTKGVRIHYKVSALDVTLLGKLDSGGGNITIQEKAPVTFSVDPPKPVNYYCDFHARLAFKDMSDLFQAGKFVDFPYYTGECRDKWDPQKPNETLVSYGTLLPPDPRGIDLPSVLELITQLNNLNAQLKSYYRGSKEEQEKQFKEIKRRFEKVQKYLQDTPQEHVQEGKEIATELRKINKDLGEIRSPDKKIQNQKLLLGRGTSILLNIVIFNTETGANCKAPMMGLTVQ